MEKLELKGIDTPELAVLAQLTGSTISLRFAGNADTRVQPALATFLRDLHAEAIARAVTEVTVDLRGLEFMNSSCFKAFVTWTCAIQDHEGPSYTIRFTADPKKHWQKTSLRSLSCFAPDLVKVAP